MEKIGMLLGVEVLVDKEAREVILATTDMTEMLPIKFSIDHPHIQGTRLEREARKVIER